MIVGKFSIKEKELIFKEISLLISGFWQLKM